jgi:ACS family tartrate transporter-like MFS transporter
LGCAAYATSTTADVVFLSVTLMGAFSMNGPFWATTTEMLNETSAAAGIAVINSIANLGGFLGPYTIGLIRTWTGSFRGGLLAVGALLAVSGALALLVVDKDPHKAYSPIP